MSVIGNIQSVSSGVTDLTKQVKELTSALKTLNTASGSAFKNAKGAVGSGFGQQNLGVGENGNVLSSSFGQISYQQQATMGTISGVAKMAMAIPAAGYAAMPSAGDTLTRAAGYYQAALYGGVGTSRSALQSATLKAMGGGLSYTGSDAAVAAILTRSIGMAPGSFGYLQTASEVGGAAKYLGMNNATAAQALGGLQTGSMGANLYQYGVNTIDPVSGKPRSTGQIATQLYNRMFVNGATAAQVQSSLQSGFAGANLRNMGLSDAQQQVFQQAFIDIAQGKNPDLASKTTSSAGAGNINPLTGQMSINQSTTQLMQDSESAVISGFNQAAKTVNAANKELDKFASSLGYLRGLIGGIGGSNIGGGLAAGGGLLASGAGNIGNAYLLSKALKGETGVLGKVGGVASKGLKGGATALVGNVVGQLVSGGAKNGSTRSRVGGALGGAATGFGIGSMFAPETFGLSSVVGGLIGGALGFFTGGGEVGYGGAFDSSATASAGAVQAMAPVQGPVSAQYGAKGGERWKGTNGVHKGVDYAVPMNSPVKASMSGTVSGLPLSSEYGTAVVISGADGLTYIYGHLSQSLVRQGQNITAGQLIGRSGKSGNCSGPCLHFEVRKGANNPIDPNLALSGAASGSTSGGPGSYSISNNYAGVSGPIKGSGTMNSWAKSFLGKMGAPVTTANMQALTTWAAHEGGNWHNTASYNPLNTTLSMKGATSINSVGVKAYASWAQGNQAMLDTLTNTKGVGYEKILSDFRSGKSSFSQTFSDISNSGWVSGHTGQNSYGGGAVGYGASMPTAPHTTGASKVVNINITGNPDPLLLAKKIKAYLDNDTSISMIGAS
jgi:hypothetical protein